MIVYHSSPSAVSFPDIYHLRNNLDFGRGFYVTSLEKQALKYADRFLLRGQKACLNIYELADDLSAFNVLEFDRYDEGWLDFVSCCRRGTDVSDYDIVIGGIANDKVFRTIDLYFAGDINKDEALKRLKYERPNHQMCLRNQRLIDEKLKFVTSVEVK